MTKLYLVRHGETVDNAAQIMQGQTPGKLNATGIAQAEEVARKMANDHIDVFISSDLYRSIQTCEIIALPHFQDEKSMKQAMITTPQIRGATGAISQVSSSQVFPKIRKTGQTTSNLSKR